MNAPGTENNTTFLPAQLSVLTLVAEKSQSTFVHICLKIFTYGYRRLSKKISEFFLTAYKHDLKTYSIVKCRGIQNRAKRATRNGIADFDRHVSKSCMYV